MRCVTFSLKSALMSALLMIPFAVRAEQADPKPKYDSADQAFRVGSAFRAGREYAKSQEPLEAALKLAPDDKYRLKVYQALIEAYRQLPDIDKMVEANEFILAKSTS